MQNRVNRGVEVVAFLYDAHTNMISYNRTGASPVSKTMSYAGNRMTSVETPGAGGGAIRYDAIGRIVSSDIEGMTEVKYNVVGYPAFVGQADGGYVHHTYTAGGARMASRRTDAAGVVTLMEYEGNEVIENGKLRMLLFDGGYVDFSGSTPRYCWYTKDHLGSVRAVADADGNVFATYAYSAYGEDFAVNAPVSGSSVSTTNGSSAGQVANGGWTIGENIFLPTVTYSPNEGSDWQPFKFSGKESLTRVGLDLYDFGARMYSPSNMRWLTMDPLCEKYYDISPYVYCAGDPVNYFDPDGRDVYGLKDDGGIVLLLVDDTRHELVYMDDTSKSYSMSSDDAFESLKGTEGISTYTTSFDNFPNIMGLFFFIADHSSSEYAVHASKEEVLIGTSHHKDDVANWRNLGFKERPLFSIHSHPGINATLIDEYWSMGMIPIDDTFKSFNPIEPSDWYWMQHHPEKQAKNFVVYFPNSKCSYILGYPQKCKRCVNLFSKYRKK